MAIRPPTLYLIADHAFAGGTDAWRRRIAELAAALAAQRPGGPAVCLQLRAKDVTGAQRPDVLARGLAAARTAGVPVLLNGSAHEASELGFDGVHWPEHEVPDPPVELGGLLSSASVHSHRAVERATRAGADMVLFAPVFAAGSKDVTGVGVEALAAAAAYSPIPVLALGGINADRVAECLRAGAGGIAVVSAVMSASTSAVEAVAGLVDAITKSKL